MNSLKAALNVSFSGEDEIQLLTWAKSSYGSNLSKTIKDFLRAQKEGKMNELEGAVQEHPSNDKALMIFERIFSDDIDGEYHGEYLFRRAFEDQTRLRAAITARFDTVFTKYQDVYLDVKDMFCDHYPKLADLMGYKPRANPEDQTKTQTTTNPEGANA